MRIRTIFAAALLGLSAMTTTGFALADAAGAQTFVEREHDKMRKLVESNGSSEQLRQSIDAMVNYDELAKRTLGKTCPTGVSSCKNHWDELTADQQREVTGLLQKLVEKNYQKNLEKTRNYAISYRGSKEQSDSVSKVKTEAKSKVNPRDPAVQIDYVILGEGSNYKVVDIITEGSSMTKNYYDQFHRMLTTAGQGYPYMVKKLNDKIAAKSKS